jgi:hypothetical protein
MLTKRAAQRPGLKREPPTIALDAALLKGDPWTREDWITQNWLVLSAFAWTGYLAVGRGSVHIVVNPGTPTCEYIPLALATEHGFWRQVVASIQSYDPRVEIVVGLQTPFPRKSTSNSITYLFRVQASDELTAPSETGAMLHQNRTVS